MAKYVYLFYEGRADMKSLLGEKGKSLADMINIGLPYLLHNMFGLPVMSSLSLASLERLERLMHETQLDLSEAKATHAILNNESHDQGLIASLWQKTLNKTREVKASLQQCVIKKFTEYFAKTFKAIFATWKDKLLLTYNNLSDAFQTVSDLKKFNTVCPKT